MNESEKVPPAMRVCNSHLIRPLGNSNLEIEGYALSAVPPTPARRIWRGRMQKSVIDEQKIRNDLRSKRELLFANFSKNPLNTRLAIEIRLLDDRISDLDRNLSEKITGQALRKGMCDAENG
jgi:hypothetical protein